MQDVLQAGLMGPGSHVFAMTSAGGHRIWPSYGAVSAAKSALESHCRQLAVELVPRRIAVNAVRAGVTDTPALRKIPGNDLMIEHCLAIHPAKRLTTPADVAAVMVARGPARHHLAHRQRARRGRDRGPGRVGGAAGGLSSPAGPGP